MFSEILKDLRSKSGISQGQLAKSVGVSPGNVSDWEVGKTKPGYVALAALARFFGVSADYLLELDEAPVKTGVDLERVKLEQGLSCDGSPLETEEASGSCRPMNRKTFLIWSISSTKSTLRKRWSLSTGHMPTREEKQGPPPLPATIARA